MERFALFGTLVNCVAIIAGSAIGLAMAKIGKTLGRRKKKLSESIDGADDKRSVLSDSLMNGIALCVLMVGITGLIGGTINSTVEGIFSGTGLIDKKLDTDNFLVIIISVILGVVIGEALNLYRRIGTLGDWVKKKLRTKEEGLTRTFVNSSLVFCVGAMSILGSMNSGILGDHSVLYTKSFLDFVTAVIFASTMGVGVMLSAGVVFLYQGVITVAAYFAGPFLSGEVVLCMTAVGSLLLVGLALNLLKVTKLRLMNFVPAIFFPIGLIPLWNLIFG